MKNSIIFAIVFVLTFSFTINAQNFKQLEKLTENLKKQADVLVSKTNGDIKKGNAVTGIEIERAFLAEQILASSKLMKRLVNDKYEMSELLAGSTVLLKMSRDIPNSGMHNDDWKRVKTSIQNINQALGPNQTEVIDEPQNNPNKSGKVFWTGMVDATVQLVIKGGQIKTRTVAGQTYPAGVPSFTSPLPNRGNYKIKVKKKDGRGKVKILQQPNSNNNYTAIIEVTDKGGGAKSYTVEISW